ncbi:hypothetical protein Harman_41720 [Haloarcula mannanilytica]|uniref:Uncharacterized protein n=1 Tax=Haloarcula mannanilytica TaxID=2509225 RepID=A0A4C2ER54_9EURY|nr:hypothetical protein [Haloarcula mannanilytica]GCF16237.1 hypothetical protein Harman_41720 [Haloarcula mannanilytica]
MTSKQIWEHEVTCHPEDIQNRGTTYSPDYRVYLPDTIKKLGLDEDSEAIVEKKYQDEQQRTPYLEGRKLDQEDRQTSGSDSVFKIFTDGSTRLRITLSANWRDEFLNYDGEDILIVEVNEIEETFRIYRNDDYDKRKQELEDRGTKPLLGKPLVLAGMLYEMKNSGIRDILGVPDNKGSKPDGDSEEWSGEVVTNTGKGSRAS